MGGCYSKKYQNTIDEINILENKNIIKYLYKYKAQITCTYLSLKKNDIIYLYFSENDLILKKNNIEYYIIYQDIIEWYNYGYYYWGFTFKNTQNINKNKSILLHVDDARIIYKNLLEITQDLAKDYKLLNK